MIALNPSYNERPRILAIAPQPFFTPRGTPLSVYYRTITLAQAAASIDLLTYGQGEDVEFPSSVRIVRIPRLGLSDVKVGPSIAKAWLDIFMVIYTIALLTWAAFKRTPYHVVHAHEESVFWCRFLRPIFRFKLIYDMHSSLPQQLTNFKFTRSRLLIGSFGRLERTCLRNADAVITICPELKTYALSHGVEPERHVLIENSIFDDVRVRNGATKSSRAAASRGTGNGRMCRRIVYAGTFEPYQGIDLLLRAFARIADDQPDVDLILVGGSPSQVAQMKRLAEDLDIAPRCTFTGQLPKSEAVRHTRAASVLVSPRTKGTNTPLKVYEQLASGIPLVATRIGSHTQVLNDDVCILADPDPASFADGLLIALDDEERRSSIVKAARKLYERDYSRGAYEAKIDLVLRRLQSSAAVKPQQALS